MKFQGIYGTHCQKQRWKMKNDFNFHNKSSAKLGNAHVILILTTDVLISGKENFVNLGPMWVCVKKVWQFLSAWKYSKVLQWKTEKCVDNDVEKCAQEELLNSEVQSLP